MSVKTSSTQDNHVSRQTIARLYRPTVQNEQRIPAAVAERHPSMTSGDWSCVSSCQQVWLWAVANALQSTCCVPSYAQVQHCFYLLFTSLSVPSCLACPLAYRVCDEVASAMGTLWRCRWRMRRSAPGSSVDSANMTSRICNSTSQQKL